MIVVELGKLRTLPDGEFRECSVCGKYESVESFMRDGKLVRTNCESCYLAPSDSWKELQAKNDHAKKHPEKEVLEYFQKKLVEENSVSVEEMIKALQKLPPKSRLVVTQSGYYAQGKFASVSTPHKEESLGENVFSLGHSSQDY